MSDENDFTEDQGEGIKNLRKQYEALKKQNDELLGQLTTFQAEKRQSTVSEVLKAKGLPATAAKLYHGEDVSEEAVGKWLEEFADVFGVKSNENDANAQNAQRVSAASGGVADSIATGEGKQPILGNPEEIANAIKTLPYEELQRLGYMPASGTLFSR